MLAAYLAAHSAIIPTVLLVTVIALVVIGALGARAGATQMIPAIPRVVGGGILAMAVTATIGSLFGVGVQQMALQFGLFVWWVGCMGRTKSQSIFGGPAKP